jgi:hypothetical protein
MYQGLIIFKDKELAAKRAAALGHDRDMTRFYIGSELVTRCECGETGVVVFQNALGDEMAFGVCDGCGQE